MEERRRENEAQQLDEAFSNTFCVLPWINLIANPMGSYHYCCVSTDGALKNNDGVPFSTDSARTMDVLNCNELINIRKTMLNGGIPKGCSHCLHQEKLKSRSFRQLFNSEWTEKIGSRRIQKRVRKSVNNDFRVENKPLYLDLRLGNKCNLKCRMCSPRYSAPVAKERDKLVKKNREYSEIQKKYFPGYHKGLADMTSSRWVNDDFFWDQMRRLIPHLRKVYFAGGEPTLIDPCYSFANEIIKKGYDKKINISLNINATNVNHKFLSLLKNFSEITLNISIDGIGKINDYIRGNSHWGVIDKNIKKLIKLENVCLTISPVYQVYNFGSILDVFNYADLLQTRFKKSVAVVALFNTHPPFLDVRILDPSARKRVLAPLQNYLESRRGQKRLDWSRRESIEGIIHLLNDAALSNREFLLKQFWEYTKALDEERKQDFSRFCRRTYLLLTGA